MRITEYVLGILSTSVSLVFLTLYLNLLTLDYTFTQYLLYICKRAECIQGIVGIILIAHALYGGKRDEKFIHS